MWIRADRFLGRLLEAALHIPYGKFKPYGLSARRLGASLEKGTHSRTVVLNRFGSAWSVARFQRWMGFDNGEVV
jgi:hypothetical protein